ncbi:SDR family NAD(P)-dependent oxidoreductase [Streptomyces sp. NBC_01356]|uniref:SDR family NAD(P)-dependent oxidoreductase n=1 Tax=Streptomyces sp. NBC_01356 TaxID=2903836 RepID=UPI002E2F6485|nr:SDR family NAD(P)-dependent oxidoreductase [Streptomyces sp. NBC_01356]
MSEKPLAGTVALVTGASSGIGAATARRLAEEGAAVALVARRRDRLDRLAEDIANLGGRAHAVEADITEPEQAYQAVQDTLGRLERLDILVNNAGIMLLGTALHTTIEEWDRMVSLNVDALLHVTHAAVPYLIDAAATSPRQVADIVNVSSTAGRVARPGSSVYNLTKFGLNGFTEALRQELLVERVRVGVVEPGTVRTELVDHLGEATREAARRQVSGIEPLRAEDIADAIGYIVTRERRVAVNEMLVRAGDQTW